MLSYATVEEADLYFSGRGSAAHWFSMTSGQKSAALEHAAKVLDHAYQWKGSPAVNGQPLRWPRKNVIDPDGILLDPGKVPAQVRSAAMEQALYMTDSPWQGQNILAGSGIKSASACGMSLSFESSVEREQISPEAVTLLRGLGFLCSSGKNAGKSGFLTRG